MSRADLNSIKALHPLAVFPATSFLTADAATVTDLSDNAADAIRASAALQVSVFTPDLVKPAIERFDLNLTSGLMTLYFSETVNGSTLNPTELIIQNAQMLPTTAFRLTGGNVTGGVSDQLVLELTYDDANTIKAALDLATSAADTFLALVRKKRKRKKRRKKRRQLASLKHEHTNSLTFFYSSFFFLFSFFFYFAKLDGAAESADGKPGGLAGRE